MTGAAETGAVETGAVETGAADTGGGRVGIFAMMGVIDADGGRAGALGLPGVAEDGGRVGSKKVASRQTPPEQNGFRVFLGFDARPAARREMRTLFGRHYTSAFVACKKNLPTKQDFVAT